MSLEGHSPIPTGDGDFQKFNPLPGSDGARMAVAAMVLVLALSIVWGSLPALAAKAEPDNAAAREWRGSGGHDGETGCKDAPGQDFSILASRAMPLTSAALKRLCPNARNIPAAPGIGAAAIPDGILASGRGVLVFADCPGQPAVSGITSRIALIGTGLFEPLSAVAFPDHEAREYGAAVGSLFETILGPGALAVGTLAILLPSAEGPGPVPNPSEDGPTPSRSAGNPAGPGIPLSNQCPVALAAAMPGPGARVVVITTAAESLPQPEMAKLITASAVFLSGTGKGGARPQAAAGQGTSKEPAADCSMGGRLAAAAEALTGAGDPVTPEEISRWARLASDRDREADRLLRELLDSIHGEDRTVLEGVYETVRNLGGRIMVREGAPLDTTDLSDLEIRPLGSPGAKAIAEILARANGSGRVETAEAPEGVKEAARKQAAARGTETGLSGMTAGSPGTGGNGGQTGSAEGSAGIVVNESGEEAARFAEGGSGVGLNGLTDWIDPYPKVRNGAIAGSIRLVSGGAPSVPVRVQATGDGVARYTRSGEDGDFLIPDVPIGVYDVVYMAPGFTAAITGEALYRKAWVGNGETYLMPDMVLRAAPAAIPGNGRGKVVNMVSGDLMAGVAIAVRDHYVLSDSEGAFSISGLEPGPASIRAMASGYRTYEASLTIVPGQAVSHTVIMEPVEAGANGIIGTDGWGHLLDWSTVVVMVRGVPHDTIKVDNGVFSVKVPALMPEYVVEARAPYCEPAVVTVAGPLYPGGTLGVSGLILRRRTAQVTFKLFTGTACEGSVYVVISGMGTFGPSSDFGGGFESRVGPVTVPQGPAKFSSMGAGALRPAHRDAGEFEMTVSGYTGEIGLYLPR